MPTLSDFSARRLDGTEQSFSDYAGEVVLVVNTASKCGFTPQYEGLEALWRQFRDSGFVVLGFPCNQFAGQEPGSESEIASFCSLTYDVTFPMFGKVEVNGEGTHPLFAWLKDEKPGLLGIKEIKWNFTKFLIDRAGRVVERYAPNTEPAALQPDIEALLATDDAALHAVANSR